MFTHVQAFVQNLQTSLLNGFAIGAAANDRPAGLEGMKKAGFWTSVCDYLLMFPLTQPVRVVLLEMLCVGTRPYQVLPESCLMLAKAASAILQQYELSCCIRIQIAPQKLCLWQIQQYSTQSPKRKKFH